MIHWWERHLARGRRFHAPDNGGNGGDGGSKTPDNKAPETKQGEPAADDPKALKAELDALRAREASLKTEIDGLKKSVGNEAETKARLAAFELREKKREALGKAVEAAGARGIDVDVKKATRFLEVATGDDADKLAAEAVDLFGSKKEEPKKEDPKKGEQSPAIKGQPSSGADDAKAGKSMDAANLAQLFKTNPEAYRSAIAETRKGNPFFS
jgi:hypothetical protein